MIFNLLYKHILVLSIIVLVIPNAKAETKDQHTKVALRTIGHEFLLQINDSTSRILPIKKIDGRYAIQFEKTFSYEPDLLSFAAVKVMEENNITENYIVEVEKCGSKEVIHSFEISLNNKDNMMACRRRLNPKGCYVFYFTIIENKMGSADIAVSSGFNYIYFIIVLIMVAFVILYFNKRRKKSKLPPDLISIGQYQFDKKGMTLVFKAESVELSSKESDLLFLLFSNENKTLEREYILNSIWGNGGNYVGRTLDVFISKLRKKLEADSNLKIINVRGVGYRFVVK